MSIAAASTASLCTDWEQEIGQLLAELSAAQDELLAILREKRVRLSSGNVPGLASVHQRAVTLGCRLESCIEQRAALLHRLRHEESPLGTLLESELLSEWALAQRLLLEVSQVTATIASGGHLGAAEDAGTAPLSRTE